MCEAYPAKFRAQSEHAGTVRRVVPHVEAVWAEIHVDGTDAFWNTIRVRNPLQNQDGSTTLLAPGDRVTVIVARSEA